MVVGTRRKSDEKGITRGEQRRLSDGFSEVAGRGGIVGERGLPKSFTLLKKQKHSEVEQFGLLFLFY